MTITSLISAVSVGASASGNAINASKLTPGGSTTAYAIQAQVTKSSGQMPDAEINVWYASTSFNETAGNGPLNLAEKAKYLKVLLNNTQPGAKVTASSELTTLLGNAIHVWVEMPKLDADVTLTVNVVELP